MIFGTLRPSLAGMRDIGFREALIFSPLVALTIIIGVAPAPVLKTSEAAVVQLLNRYNQAVAPIRAAEAARNSSFRGASAAREPGIQTKAPAAVLDSGSATRPGMTALELAESTRSVAR